MSEPARIARLVLLLLLVTAVGQVAGDDPQQVAEKTSGHEEAAALLLRGDAEEAAAAYLNLLEADPADDASRAGRVRALLALDRWREALGEARRFANETPGSDEVKAALGEALFRAGLLEEVGRLLPPLADAENPSARALMVLGRLRNAEGRGGEARSLLNRALSIAPGDRDVVYRAAPAADTRKEIVERIERYLEISEGDDPDRIESAKGKIRLYRALGERPIWVPESQPDRLEIELTPLGIPGGGGVAGYIFDASFGQGKPVPMLLDTGSTGLFMLERIARKRGFQPIAEETVIGGGGRKRHVSPRGLFPSFSVGDLEFKDALATTTRSEIEPTGRFHGIVGMSIFEGYRITIDMGRKRLLLERKPEPDDQAGVRYWEVSGQMLVPAGTSEGDEGVFLLDTGATRSIVSLGLVEREPAARAGEKVDVSAFGGQRTQARAVRGLQLEFQGERTPGPALTAVDLSLRSRVAGIEVSGFIGLDVLAGKRIVLDTRTRRVELLESERKKKKKKRGKSR
jgi:tetratricopeptide (TPR) repeat protein